MKDNPRLLFWGILSLYFLFIAYQVLHSTYLLTDDAFMLWHHAHAATVFNVFHTQGRTLTGWMEQGLFTVSDRAANVRYIRLFSLVEGVGMVVFLYCMLRRWQRSFPVLQDGLIYLVVAYAAACLSTLISVGWAACMEVSLSVWSSLAAGWLLYSAIQEKDKRYVVSEKRAGGALLLGVAALFLYQSSYPLLLLPFYLVFISRKDGKVLRPMGIALVFFFGVLLLYYGLFRWVLKVTEVAAANRTELAFKPLDRLSFFFSFPLNEAFNINAFFDPHSVVSQAIFPVLMGVLVVHVFVTRRGQAGANLRYLLLLIVWWILGYLPLLIAQESFGPYRTLIVLSIMVFLVLGDMLLAWVSSPGVRRMLISLLVVILLVRGAYVYKAYLGDPLSYEFSLVQQEVRSHYKPGIREVVFIRPAEDGFRPVFRVGPVKDEFGMPSTYKDWTPEPLVKQLVYELTGRRAEAEALVVTSFSAEDKVPDALLSDPGKMVINMPVLLAPVGK